MKITLEGSDGGRIMVKDCVFLTGDEQRHTIIGPVQHGQELWLAGCSCARWERSATTEEACRTAHERHLERIQHAS